MTTGITTLVALARSLTKDVVLTQLRSEQPVFGYGSIRIPSALDGGDLHLQCLQHPSCVRRPRSHGKALYDTLVGAGLMPWYKNLQVPH